MDELQRMEALDCLQAQIELSDFLTLEDLQRKATLCGIEIEAAKILYEAIKGKPIES